MEILGVAETGYRVYTVYIIIITNGTFCYLAIARFIHIIFIFSFLYYYVFTSYRGIKINAIKVFSFRILTGHLDFPVSAGPRVHV